MTYEQVVTEWRKALEVHELRYKIEAANGRLYGFMPLVFSDLYYTVDGMHPLERTDEYFERFEVPSDMDRREGLAIRMAIMNLKFHLETLMSAIDR